MKKACLCFRGNFNFTAMVTNTAAQPQLSGSGASVRARPVSWSAVAAMLLALFALARIAATYSVFSQTADEAVHLACGMEWWQEHRYSFEPLHPPLARVAVAALPYFSGLRLAENSRQAVPGSTSPINDQGNDLLYAGDRYIQNLTLARLGTLPFFLLALWAVWQMTHKLYGEAAALFAVLLLSTLPAALAHAGLATTDMAVTATLTWALYWLLVWLEAPTAAHSALLGLSVGFAAASKFSTLIFFPAAAIAILLLAAASQHSAAAARDFRWRNLGLAALLAFVTLWAAYRFSFHPLGGTSAHAGLAWVRTIPLPMPEFPRGLFDLYLTNLTGRRAFLLGQQRVGGFWYFFPVAIFYKTPLAFLLLALGGAIAAVRVALRQRDWRLAAPLVAAVAILLTAMVSRINLGLRHVLPLFPLLAVLAGWQAARLWQAMRDPRPAWQSAWQRLLAGAALIALLGWQLAAGVRAHPDYLAYFNELAGSHPEHILIDSDLDWGQDMLRLRAELERRGIRDFWLAAASPADFQRLHLAGFHPLPPYRRVTGWIAISEWCLEMGELDQQRWDAYGWLQAEQPVARVGRTLRLYYVP